METVLFYILAVVAVFSAIAMTTRVASLLSAVWLAVCFAAMAGIFALLFAPLVAALQLMISLVAVTSVIVLVVMLIDLKPKERTRTISFGKILGALAAGYLAFMLLLAIVRPPFDLAPESGESFEASLTFAKLLVNDYSIPFGFAGLMILVTAITVISLVSKSRGCHPCEETVSKSPLPPEGEG